MGPGRLDEEPLGQFVAIRLEVTLVGAFPGLVVPGNQADVRAELLHVGESIDRSDLRRQREGRELADPRDGGEQLGLVRGEERLVDLMVHLFASLFDAHQSVESTVHFGKV